MDWRPKYKAKTIQFLEGNIGVNLHDTRLGSDFLDMTPKAQATKEKIDKLDFIKIKYLYFKGHCQESGKNSQKEKIFANYLSDKDLVPRIYKELLTTRNKKTTQFKNWWRIWIDISLKGFPGGAVVENLPANAGDMGSSPGLGRSHMPQSN